MKINNILKELYLGIKNELNLNKKTVNLNAENLRLDIMKLQADVSLKRAEIIGEQNDILRFIEPTLLNGLSNTTDSWEKTTITKAWFDKLTKLNNIIIEHEELVNKFEGLYKKIQELEKQKHEI